MALWQKPYKKAFTREPPGGAAPNWTMSPPLCLNASFTTTFWRVAFSERRHGWWFPQLEKRLTFLSGYPFWGAATGKPTGNCVQCWFHVGFMLASYWLPVYLFQQSSHFDAIFGPRGLRSNASMRVSTMKGSKPRRSTVSPPL